MELVRQERSSGLIEYPVHPFKDKDFAVSFYQMMVRTRVLEERLIKMSKTGDGFFWIGGPGCLWERSFICMG